MDPGMVGIDKLGIYYRALSAALIFLISVLTFCSVWLNPRGNFQRISGHRADLSTEYLNVLIPTLPAPLLNLS